MSGSRVQMTCNNFPYLARSLTVQFPALSFSLADEAYSQVATSLSVGPLQALSHKNTSTASPATSYTSFVGTLTLSVKLTYHCQISWNRWRFTSSKTFPSWLCLWPRSSQAGHLSLPPGCLLLPAPLLPPVGPAILNIFYSFLKIIPISSD